MTPAQEKMARSSLCKIARWGAAHEAAIHYTEDDRRDDWERLAPYHLPIWTDCSGFVTLCYLWARLPDPNGLSYKQLGYTGTLLKHCKSIRAKQCKPGDIIVYGPGTGNHTVLIVGAKADGSILVISHGVESGPSLDTNLDQEGGQAPPVRFLRNPAFPMPRKGAG